MEQNSVGIELKKFCSVMLNEYGFNEPFSDDQYSYATDGFLIVRIPRVKELNNDVPTIVKLTELPFDSDKAAYAPVPSYEPPEMENCPVCRGVRKSYSCDECNGDGFVKWQSGSNAYEAECKNCHGDGYLPGGEETCHWCDGRGLVQSDEYEVAHDYGNGYGVSKALLEKVKILPGLSVSSNMVGDRFIPFKFLGGDGILMAMLTDLMHN